MALPTSGQLSYSEINVELGNGSTSEASMLAMATAASLPTTNASVSNFYGYSSGDTILLSWSSYPGTAYSGGYYRTANHSGHTSPQIITMDFTYSCTANGNSGGIYYSKNSTSSWTVVRTWFGSAVSGGYSITNVAYNDIIRVRWYTSPSNLMTGNVSQFNNGTVTSGSGTVTGNSTWLVT